MEQPNIVFIVIDALRARNLECYGYTKPTSPTINRLADEGVLFENAFSGAVFTDPSLTSIFSGKYPRSNGIVWHGERVRREDINRFNDSGTPLLPEILKSEGYTTLAVDWLGRWHKRGYDYYSGILSPQKLKLYWLTKKVFNLKSIYVTHNKLIDDAKVVTDKAVDLLKRVSSRKFFLFVHYWDTHVPYNPPKKYFDQFARLDYGNTQSLEEVCSQFDADHSKYMENRVMGGVTSVKEVLARYDGAIAHVDHQISRLLESLETCGILDETMMIVTADHGESLTEHGIFFGHHGLYDATIHVPLILAHGGLPRGKKIRGLVQHVDLMPTILNALGIRADLAVDGRSMAPLIHDDVSEFRDAVYVEEADTERKRAIRTSDYKYISALSKEDSFCKGCGRVHGDIEEFYNLKEDPEEVRNILETDSDDANKLKKELDRWAILHGRTEELDAKKETEAKSQEDEEIRERLRKLGYI